MGNWNILKRQPHLFLVLTVVVTIVSSMTFIVFAPQTERITAMEGYDIALPVAQNWSENVALYEIGQYGDFNEGYDEEWVYSFINPESGIYDNDSYGSWMRYNLLVVRVYSNLSHEIVYEATSIVEHYTQDWKIDSTEDYLIALTNTTFAGYVNLKSVEFSFMSLGYHYNHTCWKIGYGIQLSEEDQPDLMNIYIDCETGEIIYLRINNDL